MAPEFKPQGFQDILGRFDAGVFTGIDPSILPKNYMANAINTTVRGLFATHRPAFRKIDLSFANVESSEFEEGRFQGGGYYKPDSGGGERLMASIDGKLFEVKPDANEFKGTVKIRSSATTQQSADAPQCWMWQSEKWLIWNDGASNPVFFDGITCTRSSYNTLQNFSTTSNGSFTVPALNATGTLTVTDASDVIIGDIIMVYRYGQVRVQAISGNDLTVYNINIGLTGSEIASGVSLTWSHESGKQLPPGRMGCYGMGRNWMCLTDGKQFVASDIVGGSGGTQAESYRDAVLSVTENLFLAGGGNFTVPGSVGDIKAMRFTATLDASLGQGPLQVFTPNTVFSVNTPVDRLTWQDLQNPILTESLISNGGLGQNSTVVANGDLYFRSKDGIRSLVLGRRNFGTPGNVPLSREVDPILKRDSDDLLPYGSAVVFDNRLLMTTAPMPTAQGIVHLGLVALNFDPLSSLRGKRNPVYDGLWQGLNVLQLIVGEFNGVERCFAFTTNTITNTIELYEILRTNKANYDDVNNRVTWMFESPVIFGQGVNTGRDCLRLTDGEIFIDNLLGDVDFYVYYKPDKYPCWVPWFSFTECAKEPTSDPATATYKPQYRPSLGLGEPSPVPCDSSTNRPLREGFEFQVKIVIKGHCRFLGARFYAVAVPSPAFATQSCNKICAPAVATYRRRRKTDNDQPAPSTIDFSREDIFFDNETITFDQ